MIRLLSIIICLLIISNTYSAPHSNQAKNGKLGEHIVKYQFLDQLELDFLTVYAVLNQHQLEILHQHTLTKNSFNWILSNEYHDLMRQQAEFTASFQRKLRQLDDELDRRILKLRKNAHNYDDYQKESNKLYEIYYKLKTPIFKEYMQEAQMLDAKIKKFFEKTDKP